MNPLSSSETNPSQRRSGIALAAIALVATLAAALVLVGWWRDETSTPLSPTAAERVAAAPVPASAPEAVVGEATEPAAESGSGLVVDQVEVCKGFWVAADADGKPNQKALEANATRAQWEAVTAATTALSASASPREQAAAAFLAAHRWASDKLQRESCRDRGCAPELDAAVLPIDSGALDRLAQAAQVTDDPRVYAWAYQACGLVPRTPACLPIQAAQWTRIDPGNAVPWLALAEEARQRKDAPGEADAMFHVGAAERYEASFGALAAAVLDHVPGGAADPVGSFGAAVYVIGIEAATQPGWSGTMSFCAAKELSDANRSELCERIAVLLAERADTVLAQGMGASLAKRLGWSPERLVPLTESIQAAAQIAMAKGLASAPGGEESCGLIEALLDQVRDFGRYGELGAMKRALDASGSTTSQLAAAYRRTMASIQVEVAREAAASAASTAASASR